MNLNSDCACAYHAAEHNDKAAALDRCGPECSCEKQSLYIPPGVPIADDEIIVRVLTTPGGYDSEAKEIVRGILTRLFSCGLSIIRQGASDEEIRDTCTELLEEAAVSQTLVGAVILPAAAVRRLASPPRRYCVYDTPHKERMQHGDIMCTIPQGSGSAVRRQKDQLRYQLADLFGQHIKFLSSVDELIASVRSAAVAAT